MIHILLHFLTPALVAGLFFSRNYLKAYLLMISTMIVDIDHLLANPIYDPERCSINFHPLHGFVPIMFYLSLCFHQRTRYIGLGLIIHMVLDSIDCQLTSNIWFYH